MDQFLKNFFEKKISWYYRIYCKQFKIKSTAMIIFNKKLSVCPLTTHMPIRSVSNAINKEKLIQKVFLIDQFFKTKFNIKPNIAVTGLNPHCEKYTQTKRRWKNTKACNKKIKKNYHISGPYSADTIFLKNNRKKFNVIIGMYHDQVIGPMKTLNEYDAINITLGLPFLRVSPDHGPNEKMMGRNTSNPKSLIQAIKF